MTIQDITSTLCITASEMQQAAIDAITKTKDNIVLLSPTGSGKTLAYLLPLSQLIDKDSDDVQAIVIVPGRELAIQSLQVLQNMKTGIRGYACHGGRPTMDEHREIRKIQPQIIFATPGRLNDHIDKGNFSTAFVRYIIIDEFDKCLEMGFEDEMSHAIDSLPASARKIFLSATDISLNERGKLVTHVSLNSLSTDGFTTLDYRDSKDNDKIKINIVHSADKDKLEALFQLLCSLKGSSIVFLNYRDSVERTAEYLTEKGFVVSSYHGGLDQRQREEAIYRFSNGSTNVLVSTNLGSRGLDIPNVENVIHYHIPESEEDYTHRIGRTARWDKTGKTFFILGPEEKLPEYVSNETNDFQLPNNKELLERVPQPQMTTLYIGKGKKDKISKGDIVGFLCKAGGLKGSEIGRIDVYDYYSYVAVLRDNFKSILKNIQGAKIKGQRTKVEQMR